MVSSCCVADVEGQDTDKDLCSSLSEQWFLHFLADRKGQHFFGQMEFYLLNG